MKSGMIKKRYNCNLKWRLGLPGRGLAIPGVRIPYKTNGKRMISMTRVQESSQIMDVDVSCRFRYPCRSHNSSEHAPLR